MLRTYEKFRRDGFKSTVGTAYRVCRMDLAKHGLASPIVTQINIEVTNTCNLHCTCCPLVGPRSKVKPRFMPYTVFTKLIDELAEMGNVGVVLNFGGESLMDSNFSKKMRYACEAKKRGIAHVSFFDNAMLFDERISRVAIAVGLDVVMFSFNGLKEDNDSQRLGANYDLMTENVERLMRMKKENKAKKPEVYINLIDAGREKNYAFLRVWLPKIDYVMVSPLHNPQFHLADPGFFDESEHFVQSYCPYPFYSLGVLVDGTTTSCCSDGLAELNLGNILETSIKDVWTGSKFEKLRDDIKHERRKGRQPCERCDFWRLNFKYAVKKIPELNAIVQFKDNLKVYSQAKTNDEKSLPNCQA